MMDNLRTGPWTVSQAADLMEVSIKTVRRRIKAHRLQARQDHGQWLVTGIPEDMIPQQRAAGAGDTGETPPSWRDILREKDRQIADLNQTLGAARLRIGQLESEVKLLTAGPSSPDDSRPWWKKLLRR